MTLQQLIGAVLLLGNDSVKSKKNLGSFPGSLILHINSHDVIMDYAWLHLHRHNYLILYFKCTTPANSCQMFFLILMARRDVE